MKHLYVILLALGLGVSAQTHAAFTLELVPGSQQINLGENVEIHVKVSGLNQGTAPALGDYDVNINYDSNLFTVDNVIWGGPAQGNQLDLNGFSGLFGSDLPSAGNLHLFQISFDNPLDLESMQSDSFTLFSLVLSSMATGSGNFSLTVNAFGDAYGNSLMLDSIAGTTTVSVSPVAPVPIPAALPLLLSALGMLGLLGRSRKNVNYVNEKFK